MMFNLPGLHTCSIGQKTNTKRLFASLIPIADSRRHKGHQTEVRKKKNGRQIVTFGL